MSRSLFTRRAFAAAGIAAAGCAKVKPGFTGFAFVANEDGNAIAAVDLTAFAVVKHLRLNAAPTELISHTARKMVYALTPSNGTVHEISAAKLQRERWTALGGAASQMRLGPKGLTIYALLREPNQLVELRLETLEVVRRIALPYPPVDLDLSPEEPRALISFGDIGKVGVVDLSMGKVNLVDCGSPVGTARFRIDGKLWIAGHRDRKLLSFVDTATGKIVVRLPLAVRPDHFCFKSDRGELFISGQGSDAIAIVFPFWTEVAETVLAGSGPGAMAASPAVEGSPEYLFVTNPQSGHVAIMDIETRKLVAVRQVGAEPSHVVITPDSQYVLVLNRTSGDMAVFMRSTSRRSRLPVALFTMIPVGSKPVAAVIQAV
jgi:hypothetical protein